MLNQIPNHVALFKRAQFFTEIHSEMYTAVRNRKSYHIAVSFLEFNVLKTYFAKVHKFFRVKLNDVVYRLALITNYPNAPPTASEILVIRTTQPYTSGKIIEVASIIRKVIFTPGNPTKILEIPAQRSSE